jgi:hypothetical protein
VTVPFHAGRAATESNFEQLGVQGRRPDNHVVDNDDKWVRCSTLRLNEDDGNDNKDDGYDNEAVQWLHFPQRPRSTDFDEARCSMRRRREPCNERREHALTDTVPIEYK